MGQQICCLLYHTQTHDTSQYYNLDVPIRQSNEMIRLFVLTRISSMDFSHLLESQTSLKQKVGSKCHWTALAAVDSELATQGDG